MDTWKINITHFEIDQIMEEFNHAIVICRDLFERKLKDYGASWRLMRPQSVTDQILIKTKRIRNLEMKNCSIVDETMEDDLMAIANYGIIGLIQLNLGFSSIVDMDNDQIMKLYDEHIKETEKLMQAKNHDYDDAWESMRTSSYVDFILTKIFRIKQIEQNGGKASSSEGIDRNYMDIINYALFALILTNRSK
ncbi:conserved hypothetical protein [Candidatus Azobacteroides pseudotrichonymphae genomovar. CFP2]|jgi:hypothetical protein|uniref:Nucleotide modification associated domain-containing protein n=2 Tax=Candidatus Azobacteroides TaxID=511434 RepID=B6YQN9_AZOPC|nr:conserved hypothetical protein [Candidatus Azobacteroides pseudotrichonymphae genomovar. CFP2]